MKLSMIACVGSVLALAACSALPDGVSSKNTRESLDTIPADALLPDIVEEAPKHLGIQNTQQREWLRFSSTHWNKGKGPLQIRGANQIAPCDLWESDTLVHYDQCTHAQQELLNAQGQVVFSAPAGVAVFHVAHNHWHQNDVADFVLRQGAVDGPIVAKATKITYCLIDYDKSDWASSPSDRTYWDCNGDVQGISVGWGDEYHHATKGQEVEVTGLPDGTYYLTHWADPTNHWLESDDTNNGAWTKLSIKRQGANIQLTVLGEHSDDCVCAKVGKKEVCEGMGCGNTANK